MILTWLGGVRGVTAGCGTVMYLREGAMPDDVAALEQARSAPEPVQGLTEYLPTAQARAIAVGGERMMPLSVARMLLSMLLVATSAMVLSGRRNARSFVLQALGANAIFSVVDYLLTASVREQWIADMVHAASELGVPKTWPDLRSSEFFRWVSWLALIVVELGMLAVGAAAVLAKRSGVFLEAAAARERLAREDDDDADD